MAIAIYYNMFFIVWNMLAVFLCLVKVCDRQRRYGGASLSLEACSNPILPRNAFVSKDVFLHSLQVFDLLESRSMFLTGMPFTVAVIQIPLRFQSVNALSPLQAGIQFLPYAVLNPFGSIIAPYLAKRFRVPTLYMMLIGAIFQLVGSLLLSTSAKSEGKIPLATYFYEGLAGFGTGINLACLVVMTPFNVEKRDKGWSHAGTTLGKS